MPVVADNGNLRRSQSGQITKRLGRIRSRFRPGHRIIAEDRIEHLGDAKRLDGFFRAKRGIIGDDTKPETTGMKVRKSRDHAFQRHCTGNTLLYADCIEAGNDLAPGLRRKVRIPKADNIRTRSGGYW